jgi:hypothetical protein
MLVAVRLLPRQRVEFLGDQLILSTSTKSIAAETPRHAHLKKLALLWAQKEGYSACSMETRLPNSGYRADVVAYKPAIEKFDIPDPRTKTTRVVTQTVVGATAIFECKQVRTDYARDAHRVEPTLARLKALDERRLKLEQLLKMHHPSLRRSESLFQAFDIYDFSKLEHKTYRKIVREIGILQNRLYDKTKFEKLVRYECANLYYLVAEEGVLAGHEAPLGWGLLVHRDGKLELQRKPIWHDISESNRLWLLHRIALAGTRRLNREVGVTVEEIEKARGCM